MHLHKYLLLIIHCTLQTAQAADYSCFHHSAPIAGYVNTSRPSLLYDQEYSNYWIGTRIGCGVAGTALVCVGSLIGMGVPFFSGGIVYYLTQYSDSAGNTFQEKIPMLTLCGAGFVASGSVSALSLYGSYKLFEICWD